MEVHANWGSAGFDLAPTAEATSVFPRREYLATWWEHFGEGRLALVEGPEALLPLWSAADGTVQFLGDEDLTDYHSPLGPNCGPLLAGYLSELPTGTSFRFDSLPREAADALADALAGVEPVQHEAAQRIVLPADFERFLATRRKKERHELRRKHRRFSESLGQPRLQEGTADPVGVFIELHRLSGGRKGAFMTSEREAFFRSLAALPDCRVDIVSGDGVPVAAAIGFQDDEGYYLYNSAYDPAHSAASPGMVMLWLLIERAIENRAAIFDFLKGDEAYKLRLGAEPRPLYALTGQT
ncbi:MAG: GNAT family N-acetyltransferase [Acidimicrobiia bacterium]|nr:GNAT family N-acetyltransferase [Acidimicrobiia bacterium]